MHVLKLTLPSSSSSKPLLVIPRSTLFVTGLILSILITLLLANLKSAATEISFSGVMTTFMGVCLIMHAIPKFLNLDVFAAKFKQYDILSQRFPVYAKAYPFIEIVLGLVLLNVFSIRSSTVNVIANLGIVLISTLAIANVTRKLCSTEISIESKPSFVVSKLSITEHCLMLLMAITMIIFNNSPHMLMVGLVHIQKLQK